MNNENDANARIEKFMMFSRNDPRVVQVLEQLKKFSSGEYSTRLNVSEVGDGIDLISAGLNELGDSLRTREAVMTEKESRIEALLETLLKYTILDFSKQWEPGGGGVDIDALAVRLKALGAEVVDHINRLKNSDEQVQPRDITECNEAASKMQELNSWLEQRVLERTEQLKVDEIKYRHLFQNNPMPLWVLDAKTLMFLDVNESASKLYGYSREEFLSMSSIELRPEEERQRYAELDRTTSGTRNTGIWKHRRKDGSVIHSEVIVHETQFGGKSARLILANDVTDKVTALREVQISEARFRRIFDSKMIGFLFWDAHGTITDANELFLEMVGYTRAELQQGLMRLNDMTPPEYAASDAMAFQQIRTSGVCDPFEKEYIRKDGTHLPVMVGGADISDSSSVKGVTFVMDISERKKMEQEILELNRSLEARINERTRALREVNKELESFTYSVSHDLRAPLRAIHGYAQVLTEDYQQQLDQEGVRLLDSLKYNARRMGQLVDDLLAFSRIGKIALSEAQTDVTNLVNGVVDEVVTTEDKRARFVVHRLGIVRADNTLLRQVFQNLISNALKYSSKRDRPEIEIGVQEIDGERTWFVKDNGAGFDMAYYNKLFGVFERLHGQDEFPGTGVGLAIVQRIVQRHGGRVWAEGKTGEGATFYFTLGHRV